MTLGDPPPPYSGIFHFFWTLPLVFVWTPQSFLTFNTNSCINHHSYIQIQISKMLIDLPTRLSNMQFLHFAGRAFVTKTCSSAACNSCSAGPAASLAAESCCRWPIYKMHYFRKYLLSSKDGIKFIADLEAFTQLNHFYILVFVCIFRCNSIHRLGIMWVSLSERIIRLFFCL